jgi:hypothetical protein
MGKIWRTGASIESFAAMKSIVLSLLATLSVPLAGIAEKSLLAVDELSQDAIQSAFQVLRRDYIRRDDLTFEQLNRAALQGLLSRLTFGAELVRQQVESEPVKGGVIQELLTESVGYLRPVTMTAVDVPLVESELRKWVGGPVKYVILDLRQAAGPSDLAAAASMAELFVPRGELLFKLRQLGAGDARLFVSTRGPVWSESLVMLVDEESSNVAETLAAILRQKRRGLVIGSTTRGATVGFDEVPLEKGWRLRFARAEVLLADDTSVYKTGLKPDFAVPFSAEDKGAAFRLAQTTTVKESAFERARERYNERALVAGTNPELDDYVQRSSGRALTHDQPAPRDRVLQRALDLLVVQDFKANR